jgi:hypothetical protein
MVNLSLKDYVLLLSWFELAFARLDKSKISSADKKVFWKLTFLCEDKMEEQKRREEEEEE